MGSLMGRDWWWYDAGYMGPGGDMSGVFEWALVLASCLGVGDFGTRVVRCLE